MDNQLPYLIQAMRWEDVSAVMEIERDSFPLPWSDYTYRHELTENTHSHYIVVRARHATPQPTWWQKLLWPAKVQPILGYGGFWLIVDEAHISTLAVTPPWRGQGLGELLLAAMIEQAYGMQANLATLEVRVSNTVAQKLYTKYGFSITGKRPRYYRDNDEDAYIMTVEGISVSEYQHRLAELQTALYHRLRAKTAQPAIGQKATARL